MKIIAWIIAAPFVALGLFYLARFLFCNPDKDVEKIVRPLAQTIVEYVKKHDIPKTLNEIKDLPYNLQCENKNTKTHYIKETVYYVESSQKCIFTNMNKNYEVLFKTEEYRTGTLGIDIEVTHQKTLVKYVTYRNEQGKGIWINKQYPEGEVRYGYGKRTGICKIWRLIQ